MYRKFQKILDKWDKEKNRKPLMVIGARQIGKTWIIRSFCEKKYKDYVYVNLEEREDIRSIFDENLNPDSILDGLEIILGRSISPDVPIFFDEIQSCENAITALKYFCEDKRDFRIVCAGSLLGVKIHRLTNSFPVGKVRIADMHPMDFEEFLLACGEKKLRDGIKEAFTEKKPLVNGAHEKALTLYRDYIFTGGMPEAVQNYVDNGKNISQLDPSILKNLQLAYLADMTRYVASPQESVKITETYRSIPRQLARENPKFKYSDVRKGGNKRDFYGPIDWLEASGMIIKVNRVELPSSPLKGYEDENSFKIYISDVGLLTSLCGMKPRDMLPDVHNVYKGAVTENYVYQQMKVNHADMYYFKPSESMEIDMLFDDGEAVIPVEIKSGRHRRSTSLKNFREKYTPPYAIRISEMNFGFKDGLFSVPLYAAFCI